MWPRVQVLEFYFEQGGRINSHQSSKTIPWERADDDCHISTSFKDLATPVGAGPRPSAGTSAHGLANWMVAYIIIHRNTKSDQGVQNHQLIILIGKMMSHAHTYIHIYIYIGLPPKCQTTGMWTLQAVPPRFPASHGTIWVVATTHTTYIYIYTRTYTVHICIYISYTHTLNQTHMYVWFDYTILYHSKSQFPTTHRLPPLASFPRLEPPGPGVDLGPGVPLNGAISTGILSQLMGNIATMVVSMNKNIQNLESSCNKRPKEIVRTLIDITYDHQPTCGKKIKKRAVA